MIRHRGLSPEERNELKMIALGALVGGVVGGTISWGFDEAKAALQRRRDRKEDAGEAES